MASQLEHSADHIPMGWGGAYRHKKGVEGSRGASAECVSEHKLSQRQTNNNPGMQRTAQRSQGKNEHRAEWGEGRGSQRKHAWSSTDEKMGKEMKNRTTRIQSQSVYKIMSKSTV